MSTRFHKAVKYGVLWIFNGWNRNEGSIPFTRSTSTNPQQKRRNRRSSASSFLESKNTSKNVFFPILTFDLRNDLPSETASAGLKTLPESKLVVIGVGESSMNAKASKALVQRSPATPAKRTDAQALLVDLRELIVQARAGVARAVDSRLVTLYWHVGRRTS